MFSFLFGNGLVRGFLKCSRGAVAPMVALMLVPILGATALAVDAGYWYYKQRDMQNVADTAAIAGARTPDEDPTVDPTNDNFINVAKGTAAKYGYVDGDGTVTVDVSRVQCPSETDPAKLECTQVVIGYTSPLFFSPIVGFQGNQNGAQGVSALAVAGDQAGASEFEFCILSLDRTLGTEGIRAKGSPKANLSGCDIFSNNNMLCNGLGLKADHALAVGTSSGCALDPNNNIPKQSYVDDPYAEFAKKIPTEDASCSSSYPKASGANNDVAEGNKITASSASGWGDVQKLCGDIVLGEDITVNNKTIVIYNGRLIANGHKFNATNSTVVFSGDYDNANYSHYPTDTVPTGASTPNKVGSEFNISAPSDGDWKGVAIYQDPNLVNLTGSDGSTLDIIQSGEAPIFNISGLFYAPKSNTVIKGTVDKDGSGYNCFVLVTYTLLLDGKGEIFASNTECDKQGLKPPNSGATIHKWLVK